MQRAATYPAASRSPGESAATQLTDAKVGLLVPLIWPLEHEKNFWTSDFFNAAAKTNDTLHLFLRLVCECLLLFRLQAGVPFDLARPFNMLTCKAIALIFVNAACKAMFPDTYMQFRWHIVAHFRLYLLLITATCVMSLRAAIADVGLLGTRAEVLMQALFMYQAVKGSPTLVMARALLLVSQCNQSLLHGLLPALPFLLDIPIHFAYLLCIFRYMSAPVADIFTRPWHTATTRRICSILSALPTRQAFLLPAAPPSTSPTAGPCGVQHVWLIIMFFQLFVGCCLPLYISYTMERSLKLRYLQHKLQLQTAASAGPAPAAAAPAATPTNSPSTAPAAAAPAATPNSNPGTNAAAAVTTTTAAAATAAAASTTTTTTTTTTAIVMGAAPTLLAAVHRRTLASTLLTLMSHPVAVKARSAQSVAAALLARVHSGVDPQPGTRIPAALHWLFNCYFHACMLGLLAALSWQLVTDLHGPLARYAKPLAFPGGHYGWYWQLLCATDQPCCPA